MNWTGDVPKLSQGHPRSSQSCTWVLAWARPGWGMAWDGKVSFRVSKTRISILHGVFLFYFFGDVSRETIGFESISGKHSSQSGLKTHVFVRDIPKKSKNIAQERHKITKYRFLHRICSIWNSSPDLRNLPDQVSSAAARTLPSTRAGGQADGS